MLTALVLAAAVFSRPLGAVRTLDPVQASALDDCKVIALLYEAPLAVDYRARPYRLVPALCELPEVSADGLTYVFRVRPGKRATAADVVRSLERLRSPDEVSPNGWMLREVSTIRARDGRTVEVRLKKRLHVFPWLMAMPTAGVRLADGSGTGPFRVDRWWRNHELVLARQDAAADDPGRVDTIRFLMVDDVSTQWLMFLKGELDYLGEVSKDNWDAVLAGVRLSRTLRTPWGEETALPDLRATLHTAPTLDSMYLGVNMRDPVLGKNRKLRQALNAAFDAPTWRAYYAGRIEPSDGPVPPGVDGRLETPFAYAYDLEKAKRLLAEAGYPGGIDPATGRRLTLTLSIGRATQDSRESSELLASFYARIGIRLETRFFTWDAFLTAVDEGRVQLFRLGWVGDYPDAENFLQLFYSKNVSPGPNHAYYVNPAFDRAYEAAMAAETAEARNRHWATCQEIVREDCPWIFTRYNKATSLTRDGLEGFVPGAFQFGGEASFRIRK